MSRQKEKVPGKKEVSQGKRRKLAAKEKFLRQKGNRSRQKKKSRGKKEYVTSKREIAAVKENTLSVKI